MKILVTGAGGLLAPDVLGVARARGHEAVGLTRADLDVTEAGAVHAVVAGHAPDVVIQCAAYTAVDRAEEEQELALRVNRDGAAHMAEAARSVGALVVYVSTDYVFGGPRSIPWRPDDPAAPVNHYGRTKLEGERAVAASGAEHLVARVSWLFGAGRRSFVDAMLDRARAGGPLRLVDDQFSTPTWSRTAAEALLALVEGGARGVVHVTSGGGAASRLDFAGEAVRAAGLDVALEGVPTGSFVEAAERPPYTVLDVAATESLLGGPLPGWRADLRRYLAGG